MVKWWMVRAGDDNELIPQWEEKKVACIGWAALGNPTSYKVREAILKKADEVYEENKPGTRLAWAGQVWRFYKEIKANDRVVTYSKETREYIVGTVTKEAEYRPDLINDYYPNTLPVDWEEKRISRDILSQGAKNTLGGILTVFRIDQWGTELEAILTGNNKEADLNVSEKSVEEAVEKEDFFEQAKTKVEDLVDKLDPWEMQDLVAGLLEGMGYLVKVSPKGPDGGVDILAHKDAFGFENPIIKVQVKHKRSTSGRPEIQQLLGADPREAKCLFVSTGGFTSAAKAAAQNNGVKLIDLAEIVDLLNQWYEKMPLERQALVPLKKIYIPV